METGKGRASGPPWLGRSGGGDRPGREGGCRHRRASGAKPPNELWFSTTSDLLGGITANRTGVAVGRGSAAWTARAEAKAVVIHFIPSNGTTGGGPKIACADLS